MSKTKTAFFCQNCGFESPKWAGKCPSCNEWNTFVEELVVKGSDKQRVEEWKEPGSKIKVVSLGEINSAEEQRIITGDAELDRVLGGGIVAGSIVLVAGEPAEIACLFY